MGAGATVGRISVPPTWVTSAPVAEDSHRRCS
ncbi:MULTISPECIES: PPE family protein, SVP subgroup [Mycolicibacter]|nr:MULTISPECIES: hypothetical protein [Mycobacteriaceae]ULP49503.1 hypothetical protein MJO54_10965 [Mycolicibacter virginiensis]